MVRGVLITGKELIAHFKFPLYKYTCELTKHDGSKEYQTREVYQRKNSVAIVLYNLQQKTIILTRQFRLPVFLAANETGNMLEACAGTIEDESDLSAIVRETEEETGFKILHPVKIAECFVSPGSCSEKISLFIAEYQQTDKKSAGGGLKEEGEDIETTEVEFELMRKCMLNGEIADAKTLILLQHLEIHYFRS